MCRPPKQKTELTQARLREILSYDSVSGEWRWLVTTSNRVKVGDIAGCVRKDGYRVINVDNKIYLAHRIAWFFMKNEWPEGEIDHIDLCRSNNIFSNLRDSTHGQNGGNVTVRKHSRSGIKGVHLNKYGKYRASITIKGKTKFLGNYSTDAEASEAYAAAAQKHFGEFARYGAAANGTRTHANDNEVTVATAQAA